jgi:hypothetical protein
MYDALKGRDVVGVTDQPKQGQRVFDLLAFIESRATDKLIGYCCTNESLLYRSALPVRPIENSDIRATVAVYVLQVVQLADDKLRLLDLIEALAYYDEFTRRIGRA